MKYQILPLVLYSLEFFLVEFRIPVLQPSFEDTSSPKITHQVSCTIRLFLHFLCRFAPLDLENGSILCDCYCHIKGKISSKQKTQPKQNSMLCSSLSEVHHALCSASAVLVTALLCRSYSIVNLVLVVYIKEG